MLKKQIIHFSFDDVWMCMHDLTLHAGTYHSIFENEFFSWLKSMHDKYGAVFSLYTFNYYSKESSYDISAFPDCYAEELQQNAGWLKFGFHAKDDLKKYLVDEPEEITKDYEKFLEMILQAAGGHKACIDRVIRLGWFAGTRENVLALRDHEDGIWGLLSANDDRLPYYFNAEQALFVKENGEMWLDNLLILPSQTDIESLWDLDTLTDKLSEFNGPKVIELFSHEYCFKRNSGRIEGIAMTKLYEDIFKWACEQRYAFGFAQDVYRFK